ncbi:acyltransferase [Flavobacterium sp. D11R37]|uniref:acyltransferase family protein n=1 Tax=Flavobacterium coralii TaxID=2838017 RepID=UPI001CA6D954|nr:acyltransferase [Flavobacterium coralii]MBY8962424.1 acyltransferase [Flavobacterium coralii]
MHKLPNLYFLRFFLAITVVIYHLPITSRRIGVPEFDDISFIHKGGVAVFYFFSLSGFLIIRNLYLEYKRTETIDLKKFFGRRIGRLWPVYYLVIVLGLFIQQVLIPLLGVGYQLDYSVKELLLYYVFFLPNVFNDMHKVGGILNITWSIGIEEQFYLLFPLIFLIFRKNIKLALSILLVILISILFVYKAFYRYENFYFYFILAGLFAILAEEGKLNFMKSKLLRIVLIVLFLASFFTDIFVFRDVRYTHMANLIISNLLIVSLAYYPIIVLDKLKLNYLGEISYGIYMYHMIVTTFYLYAVKQFNLAKYFGEGLLIVINNIIIIAVTLFVSHLSYRYFETLFYKKRLRIPFKEKFARVGRIFSR